MKSFVKRLLRWGWRTIDAHLAPHRRYPGRIVTSPDSRHGGMVFYTDRGVRHWIANEAWARKAGFRWPRDVEVITPDEIDKLFPGRNAARRWSAKEWANPPRNGTMEMREIAVSQLHGAGIEVGAGASPLAVPLECDVRYVDLFGADELVREIYEGQKLTDLIVPDIVAPFEDLSAIPDDSIDFVVTCHVIEHTTNPIGAIEGAWKKLRPGGSLVFVVPEMTRTFDRDRPVTPLQHMILDYQQPDRMRDQEDFREFYTLAFRTPEAEFESVWRTKWEERFPIHYHTFTYASFGELINWTRDHVLPDVAEVWSQKPLDNTEECIEFWYSLRRRG